MYKKKSDFNFFIKLHYILRPFSNSKLELRVQLVRNFYLFFNSYDKTQYWIHKIRLEVQKNTDEKNFFCITGVRVFRVQLKLVFRIRPFVLFEILQIHFWYSRLSKKLHSPLCTGKYDKLLEPQLEPLEPHVRATGTSC